MKFKAIVLSTILSLVTTVSAFAGIGISIDGSIIQSDIEPFIDNGRTFVPVRLISESLGADVTWDNDTRTVGIDKEDISIKLVIDNINATINDEQTTLDVAPHIINGSTFVPIRFIAEGFNCLVDWDNDSQTVLINSANGSTSSTEVTATTSTATTEKIPTVSQATDSKVNDGKIYITKSGQKYHYDNTCNGGTYYIPSTLEFVSSTEVKADGRGLSACAKCVLN